LHCGCDMPLMMWALYVVSDHNATGQVWYTLIEAADLKSLMGTGQFEE